MWQKRHSLDYLRSLLSWSLYNNLFEVIFFVVYDIVYDDYYTYSIVHEKRTSHNHLIITNKEEEKGIYSSYRYVLSGEEFLWYQGLMSTVNKTVFDPITKEIQKNEVIEYVISDNKLISTLDEPKTYLLSFLQT